MRKQILIILMVLPVFLFSYGCTKNPKVFTLRNNPTEYTPNNPITVLLSFYGTCEQSSETSCNEDYGSPLWNKDLSAEREEQLSSCIYEGINRVIPTAVLLPPREGRIRFFTGKNIPPPTATVEMVLRSLNTTTNPAGSNGYIVLMTMAIRDFDSNTKVDFGNSGVWGFEIQWPRETFCTADIIDVANMRLSGTITSSISTESELIFPIYFIFPLPPFYVYGATKEDKACKAVGKAVGNFLTGASIPVNSK